MVLPPGLILANIHDQLPVAYDIRKDFFAALSAIPARGICDISRLLDMNVMVPEIGTMVGLPHFLKGRSIEHIRKLAAERRMALERKYDGEYCQIHVKCRGSGPEIQIFSKSGKDSTKDRFGIRSAVEKCLRLYESDSVISDSCILAGELVVWSSQEEQILPFFKIRKHVTRAGRGRIGTKRDSSSHPSEQLMIVFFDIFQINGISTVCETYLSRRRRLEEILTTIPGEAELASVQELIFSETDATEQLVRSLASAFANR